MMRKVLGCFAATALLACWADSSSGLRPRRNSSDYAVQATQDGVTIGATVLSPAEVKRSFATDLSGYVVVEVGIYPPSGGAETQAGDFSLRVGANQTPVRPATAEAIAASRYRRANTPPGRPSDVTVYPSVGIGYENGPVYDPATGQTRNRSGVYTSTGVGVGIGDNGPRTPPPASTDRDRTTMRTELEDKGLPEGRITQPVAGYLYFPVNSNKHRTVAYELYYDGPNGRVKLPFPPVDGKSTKHD